MPEITKEAFVLVNLGLKTTAGNAKKATDGKRKFDASAAKSSIVGSPAALAAAKRSRRSSSSGSDVGVIGIALAFAKQGEMIDWRRTSQLAPLWRKGILEHSDEEEEEEE